jgi:hypothetical protein
MQPPLTPWSLLAATGALMAFHVGLYTLVGRERKSPYVINSVFWLFLLCLAGAAIDIVAALLSGGWQEQALVAGAVVLLGAVVLTVYVVYRIAIRFEYFIDDPHPKHWPGIRHFRAWRQGSEDGPSYSRNTLPISDDAKKQIVGVLEEEARGKWEQREELDRRSLAVAVEHQGQGNKLLAKLAMIFIKQNHSVQYLTASRHPIEFVEYLKNELEDSGEKWLARRKQLVVIDAYTPHFGFIDSIYRARSRDLVRHGVSWLRSSRTFAGMHTASSKAFNILKGQLKQDERHPTLVIYEDCYALADLESPEQYRIFVRHVLPSERMWDGMFTVFLESVQPDFDWRVLQSYASMKVDLRKQDVPQGAGKAPNTSAKR